MTNYRCFQLRPPRGFTLVEVMIATLVASIALLALLGTAFMTYKINHKARLRDNARAVLRTYIDQFQRLGYAENNVPRMIFNPKSGNGTSLGLRWGALSNETEYPGAPTELIIDIGPPGSPQNATVTRNISFVNSASGETSSDIVKDAAGFMLKATFTVSYTIEGSNDTPIIQTMNTLRLID